jgi:transposase
MDLAVIMRRLDALEEENNFLRKRVKFLEDRLAKYETPKNSNNSSLPPSKDQNRAKPNQSLRKSSGKKPGGQLGRVGKTLEMSVDPDEIVVLIPSYCKACGESLNHIEGIKDKSRQIVDIPPVKAVFTEYQSYTKLCSCGCNTKASFPDHVKYPVSYGQKIESIIAYFHARQYIPFARMKEIFNDIFNISISEGGISSLLKRFTDKSTMVYQEIKQRIEDSFVIGTDETGINVNGENHWYWTWQTDKLTYITHSKNRGFDTIKNNFPNGFANSILVHDGWKAQLKTTSLYHQTCIPHLLRRLNYLNEKYKNPKWSIDFVSLLYQALELKKEMKSQDYFSNNTRDQLLIKLDKILETSPDKNQKELYTFFKRMGKERDQLFTFLFHQEVPADNNASERAIRNVKVKQKISGLFRTIDGAQNFAKIRSVIDTIIKNEQNIIEALFEISKYQVYSNTE